MNAIKKCALLSLCLLLVAGCSATSSGSADKSGAVKAEAAAKAKASGKENSAVKADLDKTARDLVSRAGRTVVPNKAKPTIRKQGKQYVATYVDVDMNSIHTGMRAGQTKSTPYIGIIEYIENTYECKGATRAAARAYTDCRAVKTRNMKELIRHDGKKWQF